MYDSYRLSERPIPKWLKKLGCFDIRDNNWRFYNKFEIVWKFGFALQFYQTGEGPYRLGLNIHLLYPGFFIPLPFKLQKKYSDIFPSWGVTYFMKSLHFNWGDRCKILHFPFINTNHAYTETLLKDETWYRHKKETLGSGWQEEHDFIEKNRYQETHPYHYLLNNGEVQSTTATCYVERRVWYYKWLEWLKWPKHEEVTVGVSFADEVGERAGSWKGGCVGCSTDLKKGQSIKSALLEMQKTRRFR